MAENQPVVLEEGESEHRKNFFGCVCGYFGWSGFVFDASIKAKNIHIDESFASSNVSIEI